MANKNKKLAEYELEARVAVLLGKAKPRKPSCVPGYVQLRAYEWQTEQGEIVTLRSMPSTALRKARKFVADKWAASAGRQADWWSMRYYYIGEELDRRASA